MLCCAPSLPVLSIIHPPTLTRPPGSDLAKPGIFKHSGYIVSNLDLRFKFGVDKEQWEHPGRVIITQIETGHVGFWVDEIREVMEIPASGWGTLPPLLPRGIFTKTLLLDKKIYLYAEFENLYNIPTSGYLRVYIEHLLTQQALSKPAPEVTKQTIGSRVTQHSESSITDKKTITAIESDTEDNKTKTIKDDSPRLTSSTTKLKSTSSTPPISTTSNNESAAFQSLTPTTLGKDKINPSMVTQTQSDTLKSDTTSKKAKTNSVTGTQSNSKNNETSTIKQDAKKEPAQTHSSQLSKFSENLNTSETKKNKDRKEKQLGPSSPASLSTGIRSSQNKTSAIQTINNQQEIQPHSSNSTNNIEPTNSVNNISTSQKHSPGRSKKINKEHENNHSVSLIIFFLLVALIMIPGLVWYLSSDSYDDTKTSQIVKSDTKSKPVKESVSGVNESNTNENDTQNLFSYSEKNTKQTGDVSKNLNEISISELRIKAQEQTNTTDNLRNDGHDNDRLSDIGSANSTTENTIDETADAQAIDSPAINQTETETISSQQNERSDFHADIQSDNTGITIVLEVPEETTVFKHDIPPVDESADDQHDKEIDIAITVDKNSTDQVTNDLNTDMTRSLPKVKTKPQPTQTNSISSTEIIHIVVKGDTLWHIAIRYVNNPYKYPELARLSNIKNPDLIYPGNRVRIIKKVRTKHKR